MNHLLITGKAGSGKNLICESIVSDVAKDAVRIRFDPEIQEQQQLLDQVKAGTVVAIIDECSKQFVDFYGARQIKIMVADGLRLAIICQTLEDVPTELLGIITAHGGFRHIAIGLNEVLAGAPQFETPMSVEIWEVIFSTVSTGTVTDTAKSILGKWMQELATAPGSAEEKSSLFIQMGVLANAIKLAEFPYGKVGDLPRPENRSNRGKKPRAVVA